MVVDMKTADGVELFVKDWGKGPPLVFTHSWAVTNDIWQYQHAHFVDAGYRVVAYDRRGHGRSDQPGSGYDVGWTEADTERIQFNGFTPTRTFAFGDGGPRMAMAVAASGAAVSPNMGYHSSPPMAFLLTIFNFRLGLWIRNPRHKEFRLKRLRRNDNPSSPWFGLFYLLAELFGMVNDAAAFVYLTDGGHFENMGLYELVRRHCMTIVICDAEQDGKLAFEGLGMAIRKCRIDFGAEIDLDVVTGAAAAE